MSLFPLTTKAACLIVLSMNAARITAAEVSTPAFKAAFVAAFESRKSLRGNSLEAKASRQGAMYAGMSAATREAGADAAFIAMLRFLGFWAGSVSTSVIASGCDAKTVILP